MLCWALAVVYTRSSVGELTDWFTNVLRHDAPYISEGEAGLPADWKPSKSVNVPSIYAQLHTASTRMGEAQVGARVADAMQRWDGAECVSGLTAQSLRDYLKRLDGLKKKAPIRWKTAALLFGAARLVKQRRLEMQRLLAIDEPLPKPTLQESLVLNRVLEVDLHEAEASERRAKDSARHSATRLTDERKAHKATKTAQKAALKTANTAWSKKTAEEKQKVREKLIAKAKQTRAELRAELRPGIEASTAARYAGQVTHMRSLKNKANARSRKAEGALEASEDRSEKRLRRAEAAEEQLGSQRDALASYSEHYASALAAKRKYSDVGERVEQMPQFQLVRIKGSGRGAKTVEPQHRLLIWELYSLGTPAAITGKAISAVLRTAAPWLRPVEPTVPFLRETRLEMRTADEAMSARRVAESYRVRQLGLDQTTKFQIPSMVTSVLVEPKKGAPAEVVILRAAYGTGGATAKHEAQAVEDKCFARLRKYLRGWEATCKRMFPHYKWTGPDPERCGLQRLGGGGCVINDTCSTACCTQELLIQMVKEQVQAKIDAAEWAGMTDAEKEAAVRCHAAHCWQHIRNIFLAPMASAMSTLLKDMLEDDLDAFTAQERVAIDMGGLLRADYKEFHQGCRYYKGAGMDFWQWASDTHASDFLVPFERADAGRQDLDFDAAVAMYINRIYIVKFLTPRVFAKGHSNILEDSIYVTHTKVEYSPGGWTRPRPRK
eukprot:7380964-Prymnesium_polylepis.1